MSVYSGFAGYESDNLWKTEDGGQSWTDISGTLPDAPIHAVTLHPQRSTWVYLATQVGVFSSEDAGTTWSATNEGPANVACYDLIWMRCQLVCVSHGRGLFEIDLAIPNALPKPQLSFDGTENFTTAAGDFTRYRLSVVNRADFANSLFRASPDLPPCGSNTNSARTWVDIFDADTDQRIYGFCALTSSDDLDQLWFAVAQGDTAPSAIYVLLKDRRCDASSQSDSLAITGTQGGVSAITTLTPGATLSGETTTFEWTAGSATVSQWWLYVGSTPGDRQHYDSGSLGTALFENVTGLPTDGSTVHVRLWHREAGFWNATDVRYTASTAPTPEIVSPVAGSTLSMEESFEWTAHGGLVSQWWLYVGSTPGTRDIFNSGSLGTGLTETVSGLPTDGRTVHVRLWYRKAGLWESVDRQYTAMTPGTPAIVSPPTNTPLIGQTVTFEWNANGEVVSQYWLYVGTTAGSRDLYDSGSLGTGLTETVSGMPADGTQVVVRLWYRVAGVWRFGDHAYTSA